MSLTAAIVLVMAAVTVLAVAMGFAVYEQGRAMVVNSRLIHALRKESYMTLSDGPTPEETFAAFKAASDGRLTHVNDVACFPPHPSIVDLIGDVTNFENPWLLPSQVSDKPGHTTKKRNDRTVIERYINSITGKGLTDKINEVRRQLETGGSESDLRLFDSVFGGEASRGDIEFLAYNASKKCSVPIKAEPDKSCETLCFSK